MAPTVTMDCMLSTFRVPLQLAKRLVANMKQEFTKGLEKGPPESDVAMLPSFVPFLPDGTEEGTYLGVDLGGTNLRIILLTLNKADRHNPKFLENSYTVPSEIMVGTGEELFDFLATNLDSFLVEHQLKEIDLSLGFVFSWPCDQIGINKSKLLWWCKGFNCSNTIGRDVVKMFQAAIDEKGLKVHVRAIMNDTVGQLVSCAYEHGQECVIGGVVSTGCNFAYMELTSRITKLQSRPEIQYSNETMIVDTEWQENGNGGQLEDVITNVDRSIDDQSVHRGKQIQDKLISGMFLGEMVRHLILAAERAGVFGDSNELILEAFNKTDAFPSNYISTVLKDAVGGNDYTNTKLVLSDLGLSQAVESLAPALHLTCHVVSYRSAAVLASAITAMIEHMQEGVKREKILIGVGGSLYKYHPTYDALLREWLLQLLPNDLQWDIVFTDKGGSKGSALVAALAQKHGL